MSTATEELDVTTDTDEDIELNPGGEDRGDVVVKDDKPEAKDAKDDAQEADHPDKAEAPAVDEPAKPTKPLMIPKDRFDEVNESLKETRRQNELLMQALAANSKTEQPPAEPAAPPVDLDALENDYVNALLDGDTAKATATRKLIRAEETRQAVEQALQTQAQQTAQQLFTSEVKAIYQEFPALDNKSPQADTAAIEEVIEWRDFLVAKKGMPLHTALRQAAERVAKAKGWGEPELKDEPNPRNENQRRRNAQTANDQPPALEGGVGERRTQSRTADVAKMTDAEFKALPEAEKKRLRGD